MEVYVLSFILCIGITLEVSIFVRLLCIFLLFWGFLSSNLFVYLQTSFSLLCPESIPTVSVVSRCPANVKEWASAAERKSCGQLRKIQNCSKAENFVYHCVLNKDATQLLEVCAPRFFLMGKFKEDLLLITVLLLLLFVFVFLFFAYLVNFKRVM